jgi:hypothetical protein
VPCLQPAGGCTALQLGGPRPAKHSTTLSPSPCRPPCTKTNPQNAVSAFVQLVPLPLDFRWRLLGLVAANAAASFALQGAAAFALRTGSAARAALAARAARLAGARAKLPPCGWRLRPRAAPAAQE